VRHWFEGQLPPATPAEDALARARAMIAILQGLVGEWCDEVVVQGNGDAAVKTLMTRDWFHMSFEGNAPGGDA
jgi:hypothetical protein